MVSLVNTDGDDLLNAWEGAVSLDLNYPDAFILTTTSGEQIVAALLSITGYEYHVNRAGKREEVNIFLEDDGAIQVEVNFDDGDIFNAEVE